MGLNAKTAAGDLKYTILLGRAVRYVKNDGPRFGMLELTRDDVVEIISKLDDMNVNGTKDPWGVNKIPLESESLWWRRKLEAMPDTIGMLKQWLLEEKESITFA
jgi:hypothetical protein